MQMAEMATITFTQAQLDEMIAKAVAKAVAEAVAKARVQWEKERRQVEAAECVLPFLIACVERHRQRVTMQPMHAAHRIYRHRLSCREQSYVCVSEHDFLQ